MSIRIHKDVKFPRGSAPFIKHVVDTIDGAGASLDIRPGKYLVDEGSRYGGECAEEGITLAGKNPFMWPTLIHEFGHFTQFLDGHPLWETADHDTFWDWLTGKKTMTSVEAFNTMIDIVLLEHDCEKRAMKLITKFDLKVDLEEYAQRANTYFYFYQFTYLNRKWIGSSTTIYQDAIVKTMPTKIVPKKNIMKIDMEMMDLYDRTLNSKRKK